MITTKRDTIDMAREAGFDTHTSEVAMNIFFTEELKVFEALVRADQREVDATVCKEVAIYLSSQPAIANETVKRLVNAIETRLKGETK